MIRQPMWLMRGSPIWQKVASNLRNRNESAKRNCSLRAEAHPYCTCAGTCAQGVRMHAGAAQSAAGRARRPGGPAAAQPAAGARCADDGAERLCRPAPGRTTGRPTPGAPVRPSGPFLSPRTSIKSTKDGSLIKAVECITITNATTC